MLYFGGMLFTGAMGTICEGSIRRINTNAGQGVALRLWYTKRRKGTNVRETIGVVDRMPNNPTGLVAKLDSGLIRDHARLFVLGYLDQGAYLNNENQAAPSNTIKVFMAWLGFHDDLSNMLADPMMATALSDPEMLAKFKAFAGIDHNVE